jgi:hypothetical protein
VFTQCWWHARETVACKDNLGKFVSNILPGMLAGMKAEHGWSTIPRVLVHDKASYMVSVKANRLNVTFANALQKGGMRSWVGDIRESAEWMVGKFGDVFVHETLISHIRRCLEREYPCQHLYETVAQFQKRVLKIENHLNSSQFAAPDGKGLDGLARRLRARCSEVVRLKGERIPK